MNLGIAIVARASDLQYSGAIVVRASGLQHSDNLACPLEQEARR